jgi:hypothetical protein
MEGDGARGTQEGQTERRDQGEESFSESLNQPFEGLRQKGEVGQHGYGAESD